MVERRQPRPIQVIGLVRKPGQYEFPINHDLRLFDAIALAKHSRRAGLRAYHGQSLFSEAESRGEPAACPRRHRERGGDGGHGGSGHPPKYDSIRHVHRGAAVLESLCTNICAPCAHVRRTDLWSVATDQRSVPRFGCGSAALGERAFEAWFAEDEVTEPPWSSQFPTRRQLAASPPRSIRCKRSCGFFGSSRSSRASCSGGSTTSRRIAFSSRKPRCWCCPRARAIGRRKCRWNGIPGT